MKADVKKAHALVWLGGAAGPVAWSIDLLASYALVHRARESGSKTWLLVVTLIAIAITLAGAWVAWWGIRELPKHDAASRTWRGVGWCGLALDVYFLLLIAANVFSKAYVALWE